MKNVHGLCERWQPNKIAKKGKRKSKLRNHNFPEEKKYNKTREK